ncbi:MAG TPA: T9SS type A sorting domain-containing protein [Bacteroidia bacterium]|nr:T9SS type A sorting domain-containing protein [Bacteroidia bacterium]
MKKIILIALLLCIKQINAQTTISGGYVYGTWSLAGSPYLIQSTVEIPNDSTLTIQPGVTVNFQGHYKIIVLGKLLAIGTQTDSIFFTAANTTTGWYGIRFDGTTANNDSSKFYYCNLQWGKAGGSVNDAFGGAFMFNGFSKAIISNCLLKNNANYVIYCNNGSPTISNNKILNSQNGAIDFQGSNPYIANNIISYNNGDAISGSSGGPIINIYNNIISHNAGCGIHVGHANISYNTISYNNASYWAGAIYATGNDSTIISHNIISYNICPNAGYGSGICCYICGATIRDNVISNNSSPQGPAINIVGGIYWSPVISNNVIVNNTASASGGAISIIGTPTITNNTIANNSALNGGALSFSSASNPSIYNCILYGNTATASGSQVYISDEQSDPNFYYCDIQGGSSAFNMNGNFYSGTYQNNIDVNPLFVSPSAGNGINFNGLVANWALQSASICINAGNPSGTYPSTDLAGNPRVFGSSIDMGAYEFQGLGDGINQFADVNNAVNIYPNPAQNNFTIQTTLNIKQTVEVFDVNGNLILMQTINGTTNIDVTNLNAGVYNINMANNYGVTNKRLVIVK